MNMSEPTIRVLFLCKGNSARSIMAEAILNHLGQPKIKGFSAGSQATGAIHPHTIQALGAAGYNVEGLTSKPWTLFGSSDAPQMDLVITVCDSEAEEACPAWPGRPARAHWSLPDPVKESADHDDAREPFRAARQELERRIRNFLIRLTELQHVERSALEIAANAA